MSNPIKICNKALIQIGAEPIVSFDDNTVESEACEAFYEDIVVEVLTQKQWSFATFTTQLTQLNKESELGYDYVFALPVDYVFIYNRIDFAKYQTINRELHTSRKGITIEYTKRVGENEWPSYFTNIIQYRMAAELCPAITDNSSRTQIMEQKFRTALTKGIAIDGGTHTTQSLGQYSFLAVR